MKTIPLSEAKAKLSKLVDTVARRRSEQLLITRNGRASAILMNPEEFESWQATLDVMSDPELMAQVRRTLRKIESGTAKWYSFEDIFGPESGERRRAKKAR